MENKKLNIAVIGTLPFPSGFAETYRLVLYAKGIIELGNNIKIFCLYPTESVNTCISNKNIMGIHEGVAYQYTCGTTVLPGNKIKRILLKFKGILHSVKLIYRLCKQKKTDALIMATREPLVIFVYYLFTRIIHKPIIHEAGEYPFILPAKSIPSKIDKFLYMHLAVKLFDGIFSPTKALIRYFGNMLSKKVKLALITMIVDPKKYKKKKKPGKGEYIAYCGDFGYNKDGVPILVDAFKTISARYENINLVLIGSTTDLIALSDLKKQVESLELNDRVVFTGRVEHNEIPGYICNAKLLVLSRPANKQAEGGFPGKLGEYLATGNPVVVTKVGEIPDYLADNKTAYLSEPDCAAAFAECMDRALSDYKNAVRIGLEGRKLTYTIFHYRIQAQRLIDFIHSFL